jgi:hypothetical protein
LSKVTAKELDGQSIDATHLIPARASPTVRGAA